MNHEPRLARTQQPAEEALALHPLYRGKIETGCKCPIERFDDFSIWYTPGVAAPSRAIAEATERVYEFTNKGNTVAIVTDGTRVLGLGDIGPEAAMPVMEGKALLFKYLGGVDAVPICLRTTDPDEIVRVVRALEPSFGGINLEDIAQPKCFRILDALRAELAIPVWHDDQQGTATVTAAALESALEVVGKRLAEVRIALVGCGAANVAVYRLLRAMGFPPGRVIACDSKGTLHARRDDVAALRESFVDKWKICLESNEGGVTGGVAEALAGADVCIAFSRPGPGIIDPAWIRRMNRDAIVFACANPTPEVWPWQASEAGARVVATGRSDFANQLNNSLVFPGIFRGALEVRARAISDGMTMAASRAVVGRARELGLDAERILPSMDDEELAVRVAIATAEQAVSEGLAGVTRSRADLENAVRACIGRVRRAMRALLDAGVVQRRPR